MIKKAIVSVIWTLFTIFLFCKMMEFYRLPGGQADFRLTRILFSISIVMQALVAIGVVKIGNKK